MNYGRAIRIVRSLADVSQRELAGRLDIDPSLVSMVESGKRKPSRELLERFASDLKIPFHLLILLATEAEDSKTSKPDVIRRLGEELASLIFMKDEDEEGSIHRQTPRHRARKQSRESVRP
jgi:transcriptional regulator with XRE-family HTH domain